MEIDWRFEISKNFLLRLSYRDEIDPKIRKKAGELYSFLEDYKIKRLEQLDEENAVLHIDIL